MTPDMAWDITEKDHVKPIFRLDLSNDVELRGAFNWESFQILLKKFILKKELNLFF